MIRILKIVAFLISSQCILECMGASVGPQMLPGRKEFESKYGHILNSLPGYKETVHGVTKAATSSIDCSNVPDFDRWRQEVRSYQPVADRIMEAAINGSFKGKVYNNLANFVYKFGYRMSGTDNLEESIDYMLEQMETVYNFSNVHGEEVVIPRFHRGKESATMHTEKGDKNLPILALFPTVSTPAGGIRAKVLVVRTFEELERNRGAAVGKIVVFNQEWTGYGSTNRYRSQGASAAARAGAVASLTRSVAPFSLDTPHTGGQNYAEDVDHIPTGCITHEDADLLQRYQDDGIDVEISLELECFTMPSTTSRNAIGEITGSEKPDERVILTGHIDSWDVGIGAMDDAGGFFLGVEALALLKSLDLQPKRSLQAVMWTSEEEGLIGVEEYARRHADELENLVAAFESDSGSFLPLGLEFAGSNLSACIVQEVAQLLSPINANAFSYSSSVQSDISVLIAEGVPGVGYMNQNDKYFWFHHTHADTMLVQDSDEMDRGLALWATAGYVIANLTDKLPRNPATPRSLNLGDAHASC